MVKNNLTRVKFWINNTLSMRKSCKHYLSVCCLPPEIESAREILKQPKKPETGLSQVQKPKSSTNVQKQGSQSNSKSTGVNGNQHQSRGCGIRNENGISFRIIGGMNNEANFGEYPWMVAILQESTINDQKVKVYKCGGSLIHKRVVLTAAHCVEG